jgi:hypothetical protein
MSRIPKFHHFHSPDRHDFDHLNDPGKASIISHFMAAGELTTALGTPIILFAVAFFPASGYVRTVAMRAFDFYG